jgi:hypothetical protein
MHLSAEEAWSLPPGNQTPYHTLIKQTHVRRPNHSSTLKIITIATRSGYPTIEGHRFRKGSPLETLGSGRARGNVPLSPTNEP